MPPFAVTAVAGASGAGLPDGVMRVEYASGVDGARDWALMWTGSEPAGDPWIVNLHGHGSQGDQLFTRPDIRQSWLPAFRSAGGGIVAPNLRGNAWMSPAAAADLHSLLAWVRRTQSARRFVLAGGSMGGSSILSYAVVHPADVDAAVALCPAADMASYWDWCRPARDGVLREIGDAIQDAYGGAPRERRAAYAAHSAVRNAARLAMPLYVAHGARDTVIPVSQPRRLVGALADARDFVYVEVPDGEHDAPLPLMPAALEWALRTLTARRRAAGRLDGRVSIGL